mgnify:CR=1 FL=1
MNSGLVCGLTGGIGSGKSYVARLLHTLYNIPVYDCDREARRLMVESDTIRRRLAALIGPEAYTADGQLCKPVIARYLFASPQHATQVNAIVHPAVKADIRSWAEQQRQAGASYMLVESAILVEAGFLDAVDFVVAVEAPEELRLERAMQRDNSTAQQTRQRMDSQLTDAQRRAHSHFIITNDGQPLQPQLQALMQQLQARL